MERTLYLWHSSEEKVAVDLHLVVLADQDGACGQVSERENRFSLEACFNLGEYETAAKPPSERVALHSVGFFKLRRVRNCS